jgi:GrpB-like predicted nucleotidyltransferase (UPF0157 family)
VDEGSILPYPDPGPPAVVRPWPPGAPEAAARAIALIAGRLPESIVEHVGSSSVPGCDGKGYLDLLIPCRDAAHLAAINDALFDLGFARQRGDDPFPESRPMRLGAIEHGDETFLIHVHIVPEASPEVAELLGFRDRLRADAALREAYVAIKRDILAAGVGNNREYSERKGKFIIALGYKGAADA